MDSDQQSPEPAVKPIEGVKISEADFSTDPLMFYELVVVVEPDPQTWMIMPDHVKGVCEVFELHNTAIIFELHPDEPLEINVPQPKHLLDTKMVRLYYEEVDDGYYTSAAWRSSASFRCRDYGESKDFIYYLKGLFAEHANWRVAVIGAVFEDEIITVANQIAEMGFDTTILTRHCVSSQLFFNLDNLSQYQSDYRRWLIDNGCDPADTFYTNLLFDEDEDE